MEELENVLCFLFLMQSDGIVGIHQDNNQFKTTLKVNFVVNCKMCGGIKVNRNWEFFRCVTLRDITHSCLSKRDRVACHSSHHCDVFVPK